MTAWSDATFTVAIAVLPVTEPTSPPPERHDRRDAVSTAPSLASAARLPRCLLWSPPCSCSSARRVCWCWRSSPGVSWHRTSASASRRTPRSSARCSRASPRAPGSAAAWPTGSTRAACIGPTIALGGLLAMFTVPVVRSLGNDSNADGSRLTTIGLTVAGFFLPAFVLSAVHPMVVKLQLHDLARTGRVVGRLSGVSTAGALVGTFVTGFLLVSRRAEQHDRLRHRRGAHRARRRVHAVAGAPRQRARARRRRARWRRGDDRGQGADTVRRRERVLLHPRRARRHRPERAHAVARRPPRTATSTSTTRPTLQFTYVQSFADVVAAQFPDHPAIDALHIGGGGFTLPRYLRAEYPGSTEHRARDRPRGAEGRPRGARTADRA